MSQSPSYQRDSPSASPESPTEGDFSPRQLYDNLKSLEEQETCDGQRDPFVNITTDNCSSSRLNIEICAPLAANDLGKLCAGMLQQEQLIKESSWSDRSSCSTSPTGKKPSVSPEIMEMLMLDGRLITLVNTQTQTDWEWVEQSLTFSCLGQKGTEDPLLLQAEVLSMAVTDSSELNMSAMEDDAPRKGPPRLIAYKPEPKQTPRVEKVPEAESKQDVPRALCEYCRHLLLPFAHSVRLENGKDFEEVFCCEQDKQMRALIKEEREKLEQKASDREIDEYRHAPFMREEERERANAQAKERLRLARLRCKLKRETKRENLDLSSVVMKHKKISFKLSEEDGDNVTRSPQINIKHITSLSPRQAETDGEPKPQKVIQKFYKSGKHFLILYPDRTGNVFYPSGEAAIIISSTEAADFTYIILEDKDKAPNIKGIFTNKGHTTCYHSNGKMRLNLTPAGGLCFSETGALLRRWNWFYRDPHVRILPFKPLTFALGPHISVRIHSHERIRVNFAYQRNSVHFNVGSKLKPIQSLDKPEQDVLKRYIQMKSSEINSLLGQMQTCMSHHSASQH